MSVLDEIDMRLLGVLQTDARRTLEELAREVPLSPSAIARRLRRLRKSGVIAAEVALLDLSSGPSLSAIVEVKLERHALRDVEALLGRLAAHPSVAVLLEVSGAFDLLLMVVTACMDAFNAFTDEELASDPGEARYETRFVKKRRKFSMAAPILTSGLLSTNGAKDRSA